MKSSAPSSQRVKYYGIHKGRQTGVFTDWTQVEKLVKFSSDAQYRAFNNYEDAEYYSKFGNSQPRVLSKPIPIGKTHVSCLSIYTDGSCIQEKGGYAYIIPVYNSDFIIKSGPVPFFPCTNQKAELYAIIQALKETQTSNIKIYTDSKYVINSLTLWIHTWIRNGWTTVKGKPIENRDLIEQAFSLMTGRNILFEHVQAHSGNYYNELADKFAKMAIT